MVKVSIILTCHNYGAFVGQAIESCLRQTMQDFEIVVVNDNSNDDSAQVISKYAQSSNKIKSLNVNLSSLAKSSNAGILASSGNYIIRLDADDFFDENCLLVQSNFLDANKSIGMVYCDYFKVDKGGELIEYKRLPKVNDEIKLLDRSALGSGCMYRRERYNDLGGYDETLKYQEDYDFWVRFTKKFKVANINLPLMYYRQHGNSMSRNFNGRMEARRYVKDKILKIDRIDPSKLNIVAIIPARADILSGSKIALKEIDGKPLIAYTIQEALKVNSIRRVIVNTDDQEIADVARSFGAQVPFLRPKNLSENNIGVEHVVYHTINSLESKGDKIDIVVLLQFLSPLRKSSHIKEAIDTLFLHNTDSVISVCEDIRFYWQPGPNGLVPLTFRKRLLRKDKETFYRENAAIYAFWRRVITDNDIFGEKVGHILMSEEESIRITNDYELWLVKSLLKKQV